MASNPGGSQGQRVKPGNDIYTLLVGIALALVAGTVAFVIYRCYELFGTPFPGFTG